MNICIVSWRAQNCFVYLFFGFSSYYANVHFETFPSDVEKGATVWRKVFACCIGKKLHLHHVKQTRNELFTKHSRALCRLGNLFSPLPTVNNDFSSKTHIQSLLINNIVEREWETNYSNFIWMSICKYRQKAYLCM